MAMDDMDYKAAMNSEIFREYAKIEKSRMQKEAYEKEKAKELEAENDFKMMEQFAAMELEIKDSPKKLLAFKALKEKFATDQEYTKKVNPLFVQAVMMLNLD